MRKILLPMFTFSAIASFVIGLVMWLYVDHVKDNNGSIDMQPNTTEFVQKYTISKYLVFCFWTAGSEGNVIPGTDDYSSWSDTIASTIGLLISFLWFGMVMYIFYLYFDKKIYPAPALLIFGLLSITWFWYNTIKIWPVISNFIN